MHTVAPRARHDGTCLDVVVSPTYPPRHSQDAPSLPVGPRTGATSDAAGITASGWSDANDLFGLSSNAAGTGFADTVFDAIESDENSTCNGVSDDDERWPNMLQDDWSQSWADPPTTALSKEDMKAAYAAAHSQQQQQPQPQLPPQPQSQQLPLQQLQPPQQQRQQQPQPQPQPQPLLSHYTLFDKIQHRPSQLMAPIPPAPRRPSPISSTATTFSPLVLSSSSSSSAYGQQQSNTAALDAAKERPLPQHDVSKEHPQQQGGTLRRQQQQQPVAPQQAAPSRMRPPAAAGGSAPRGGAGARSQTKRAAAVATRRKPAPTAAAAAAAAASSSSSSSSSSGGRGRVVVEQSQQCCPYCGNAVIVAGQECEMPRRPVSGSGGKGRYRVRQTPRKENRLAQWYQKYGYVRHRHKPASSHGIALHCAALLPT